MATPTTSPGGICDQLLNQLAKRTWQPGLFKAMLPALAPALLRATPALRLRWAGALDAVWQRGRDDSDAGNLAFELGLLAGDMQRWKQACSFFLGALDQGRRDALVWHNLGQAQWQLAQHEQAEASCLAAVGHRPDAIFFARQLSALQDWRRTCLTLLDAQYVVGDTDGTGPGAGLIATPLGPHHALPLLRLQGDSAIADNAKVTRLTSLEGAHAWIHAATAGARITLAVIAPDDGLIGIISLDRHLDAAIFYYWIGVPFQRKGYGTLAIGLLKTLARQQGIRALFSAVYDDNRASRTVLQRNGFRALGVAVTPPEPLAYYAWYCASYVQYNVTQQWTLLQALLASAGSSRQLALPAATGASPC